MYILPKLGLTSLYAAIISTFMLTIFYFWFARSDRYAIFLYNHLGATPFDESTRSRYWMTGLVASGIVMVLYTLAHWCLGLIFGISGKVFIPPAWWRVWLASALPLSLGVVYIAMTLNSPTLPLVDSLRVCLAALIGLGLALWPGNLAAQRPVNLAWLFVGGTGLVPSFLLLRAVELPSAGLVSLQVAYIVAIGGTLAGAVWLGGVSWLKIYRTGLGFTPLELFLAGACWSYLLLTLIHHLFFTLPAFRYISSAGNFFAFNPWVQVACWFVSALLAMAAVRFQKATVGLLSSLPSSLLSDIIWL